ncbi:hypothetical protein FNV43_RR05814 [Rhamnella rubrinervis]|uniref:Uncharacterized protein n=1 Tax=Rhamnella rubrinervis TaxID=2594499 RepID=A0A8K0MRK5_9ROSA|nr:hypothetical protein FNV43_RR05814 [Rhamnella rubrinervis]
MLVVVEIGACSSTLPRLFFSTGSEMGVSDCLDEAYFSLAFTSLFVGAIVVVLVNGEDDRNCKIPGFGYLRERPCGGVVFKITIIVVVLITEVEEGAEMVGQIGRMRPLVGFVVNLVIPQLNVFIDLITLLGDNQIPPMPFMHPRWDEQLRMALDSGASNHVTQDPSNFPKTEYTGGEIDDQ